MAVSNIVNLIPTAQALSLAGHNIGIAKKKNVGAKDIIGAGVTNIVGLPLIRQTAALGALV